jgi:uncharacterized cupredoxin-like copper-binding protein
MKVILLTALFFAGFSGLLAQDQRAAQINDALKPKIRPAEPAELAQFGIYEKEAPQPAKTDPVATALPLTLKTLNKGDKVVFIGNTLFDRGGQFPHFETLLHQAHPGLNLVVRTQAWSADEVDLMPRPDNFGDVHQHLRAVGADVIFAAFGFNESFGGVDKLPEFKTRLAQFLTELQTNAYNGTSGPRVVLVSPIANENVRGVAAADTNNARIAYYVAAMEDVAAAHGVGFVNVFDVTHIAMDRRDSDLTTNGVHLTDQGYRVFGKALFRGVFQKSPPQESTGLIHLVADKNRQYFRRFRPVNTFYYTGGRKKKYGYLDFLPAMRNFELMVENRDRAIWELAMGKASEVDDSNLPPLDDPAQTAGANQWLSPKDELAAFKIDPRVEVNLFASEEEFPDIACPIQMRWDGRGRLWVSCSTTYPHVYPGSEPNDKIVILEDTDWDGKADQSTVFADHLHIPLSFVLGDGGVYVSEQPHVTFLKDTDGDDRADVRRQVLTGFGTEDSHHSIHDFVWTPDGDLLFRESIFHHSQVETAYGPVRAANSAWFLFTPSTQRLRTFGGYPNTNPWGVTFTEWGHHVASHPIFASAFHAANPPYPEQHPRASGIPAYSGVCGHEFLDWASWPEEFQGGMVKVRYKPTNRVEFHKWVEKEDHFAEQYQSNLIFSSNLSFIPVDLQFGPRGGLYVCDWYNPVKGHAQYSLRDDRRDRESGRIWRMVPKESQLAAVPKISGEPISALLEMLKRPEYRVRYWVKRELRQRDPNVVTAALRKWVAALDPTASRFRHHQLEALWLDPLNKDLLDNLANCDQPLARAAAVKQLYRYPKDIDALAKAAVDESAFVRMEAATTASHIGSAAALEAMLPALGKPYGSHLGYALATALGSENLSRHWKQGLGEEQVSSFIAKWKLTAKQNAGTGTRNARDAGFDSNKDVKVVKIGCVPGRLLFDVTEFEVKAGQRVKLVFRNSDATPHNLVVVSPGAADEIGMAGNEMAKDPEAAKKGFVPDSKKVLFSTKLLEPDSSDVLRFKAPKKPGDYPYVCTFPGHWILMRGVMKVK